MKYTCPYCGYEDEISVDELASLGNSIKCPMCLKSFAVDENGKSITVSETHDKSKKADVARPEATVTEQEDTTVCHACHAILPGHPNFCSNCGADLTLQSANDKSGITPPPPLNLVDKAISYLSTAQSFSREDLRNNFKLSEEDTDKLIAQLETQEIISSERNGVRTILVKSTPNIPALPESYAQPAYTDNYDDYYYEEPEEKTHPTFTYIVIGGILLLLLIYLFS